MAWNDPQWGKKATIAGRPTWTSCGGASTSGSTACSAARSRWRRRRRRFPAAAWRRRNLLGLLIWRAGVAGLGGAAAFISSTRASAAWCCASASTSRPPSPGRAGTCRGRSRSREIVNVDQVRTVEVGYPRQRQEQGAERIADADGRREHHRPAIRGAVHPERSRGIPVQQPSRRTKSCTQAAETRDARNRRQEQDGFRAVRRPRRQWRRRPRS